ncbi:MAG: 2'-5' RNA ligase family protein [Leifsonia sp.]
MPEVAVVFPLEQMQVGDTYVLNDIPLHLTVLSNARLTGAASGFVDEVRRAAEGCAPFTARALGLELFGPNANIPVTEVTVVPTLRRLHEALCEAVLRHGGEAVEPAYWGADFRAHVTKTPRGLGIDPGSEVRLDRVALIDCSQPIRKVIWTEPLAHPV